MLKCVISAKIISFATSAFATELQKYCLIFAL